MKKTVWILVPLAALLMISACSSGFTGPVDVGSLVKPDGSYGWGQLTWGMDIGTVESTLGYTLSENANEDLEIDNETDYRTDRYEGSAVFRETKASSLFGAKGIVYYTFSAGSLKDVWITCDPEDNSQEQLSAAYEQTLTELVSLYGEPDEAKDSDAVGLFSVNSHWTGSEVNGKKDRAELLGPVYG